ncbi:flagellar motor switch protein FliM [Entomospira nematocerorum]|uniref:Flagellar motor switch protein FliM n=1 Tax=Entomospira nematocerorum TaxID=2719987 RepID=A0A968GFU5_9SPIO|nr:flagellar motor switch protein FliM [Entomospira nematocera]NIZ47006.1 flagellar motor switch protein FliM [Entomospira nematocera]WDI34450.1 flagellar motor switch protein FliM [Entomospira nematocera]
MTEVLSQDEIDQLLTTISQGSGSSTEDIMRTPIEAKRNRSIKIYDFKRPDKFSKEQIRTVSIMHETFSRLASTSLSAQLRALVSVHVASVDQLTYEEFLRSIPNPTALSVINMDPLKGSAILEIDPSITFSIIDRLFGGTGESSKINRELTEIEVAVLGGIVVRLLSNMKEAWSQVIELRARLGQIETNPQFAQIVPPSEMVILVTMETKIEEIEGMMNFCIPYLTIEPIISKLSAQYWYASVRRGFTTENLTTLKEKLSRIHVDIVAEVGRIDVSMRDIMALKVGDLLRLPNTKASDSLILKIGDRSKFECRPGVVGKRVSVQITHKLEEIHSEEFNELIASDREDD